MLKKLSMIGSSKGLILDKTLLCLLGIENAAPHITPPYKNPIEELRVRVPEAQNGDAIDAAINTATRKVRTETVRKLKASRAGRRP